METRKITVVSTKTQTKDVVMSKATTLGELKHDLDAAGIEYDNLVFYEGLSKTELKEDDSILPHDLSYRGNITNELVFLLTVGNKKVSSGSISERKEAYEYIKEHDLQAQIKESLGATYSSCSTDKLLSFVNNLLDEDQPCTEKDTNMNLLNAFRELVDVLYDANYIDTNDYNSIMSKFNGTHIDAPTNTKKNNIVSPYSDEDINKLFNL